MKVTDLQLYTEKFDGDVTKDRQTFIGGSDVGTILGVNPYKSAYTLFMEKTNQVEKEDVSEKLQVRLGHLLEPIVAELYEQETGYKVEETNLSYRVKDYPFLIGHIDRKIVDEDKGLEIKTTSGYNKTDFENGEVQPNYYYQCMFYMMITGMHDWELATLQDNRKLHITHISWNEEQAQYMLDKVLEFWDMVEKKEWTLPLDDSDSTAKTLASIDPPTNEDENEIVLFEDELPINMADYDSIVEQAAKLNSFIESVKNTIKEAMQGAEYGQLGDYEITYKQYQRKGAIDTKKLQKENPEIDVESYRKAPAKYRQLKIKKNVHEDV